MTFQKKEVACDRCGLFGMCRVVGLGTDEGERFNQVVSRREHVAKGDLLCEADGPFQSIFAVKSGAFKSFMRMDDGSEQIVDFHFPGELIGLEGVATRKYGFGVRALTPASVCRMQVVDLALSPAEMMRFQQRLSEALSRKVHHSQGAFMLIGSPTAERTLALFLLGLSDRFAERGLPAYRFRLPMGRDDIANYLGLANETVSRLLNRFQSQGIITVRARDTQLCDVSRLRDVAGLTAGSAAPEAASMTSAEIRSIRPALARTAN